MQKKMLFIDDNEELADIMQLIFERRSFEFYSTELGKEGIKMAEDVEPDVIILDIGLPDIEGFDVCKKIKENKRGERVPIIFITGKYFSEGDKEKGLKLGAEDFLIKPFDPDKLIARINKILEEKSCSRENSS